jgi:uncharacterized protein YifN (PemK superfamily)
MTFDQNRFESQPAYMFGKRLVVVKNAKVPENHIILAVHPSCHLDVLNKAKAAFARWAASNPAQAAQPSHEEHQNHDTEPAA